MSVILEVVLGLKPRVSFHSRTFSLGNPVKNLSGDEGSFETTCIFSSVGNAKKCEAAAQSCLCMIVGTPWFITFKTQKLHISVYCNVQLFWKSILALNILKLSINTLYSFNICFALCSERTIITKQRTILWCRNCHKLILLLMW